MIPVNTILQGNSLGVLKTLPNDCVDTIITSPPYWALRDYGVEGQLGLEPTFQEYIKKLCDIFDEVRRVLKKEGTCFVNLGDTYAGNKSGYTDTNKNSKIPEQNIQKRNVKGVSEKSLYQIPSRFAIEMCNRSWILRNEIIWHKPNCMPQSADDRFTVDFEKVFFFVKNKRYYFNQLFDDYAPSSDVRYRQALRANRSYNSKEPYQTNTPYSGYKRGQGSVSSRGNDGDGLVVGGNDEGRNKRTVWSIPTMPYDEAHFATFPESLIEPMMQAGCPEGGVVLDPFMGAGTTALVAKKSMRNYLGIELNPEYIKIAHDRLNMLPTSMFAHALKTP